MIIGQFMPHYRRTVNFMQRHPARFIAQHAPMKTLAERLRSARKEAGLTQHELTRRAGLKGQSIIGGLESGGQLTSSYLPQLAAALGVNALWLAEGVGPRHATYAQPEAKIKLDAGLMYRATLAVDVWLKSRPGKLTAEEKVELACYLYEMFADMSPTHEQLITFLERWAALSTTMRKQ